MSVIGCLLGFVVLIILTYKDWSVFLAAFVAACVVIIFSGMGIIEGLTVTYVTGATTALKGFYFLLMFGSLQAALYRESGAAYMIAHTIMRRLIRESTSNTAKNLIGIIVIMIIGGILNLGGIIAGVVIVLMYPIALEVFELCDIPKRFILGTLAAGSFTFPQSMPGSPQVGNVAAMTALGTPADAALIPGLIGVAVEFIMTLFLLNILINNARKKGDRFERHPLDPQTTPDMPKPNFWLSLLPMVALFFVFNAFKLHIVPCLIVSNIVTIILFRKQLVGKDMKQLLNKAAADSIPMTMSVGAITGFGGVVAASPAFQTILEAITKINAHPVVICAVSIGLLASLTGGCSTSQLIGLPLIAPHLQALGLSVNIIHRVSTFASTTLDTMPYSGSILMLLPMSNLKLREAYPAMFITTVAATFTATAVVSLICIMFPGLAG